MHILLSARLTHSNWKAKHKNLSNRFSQNTLNQSVLMKFHLSEITNSIILQLSAFPRWVNINKQSEISKLNFKRWESNILKSRIKCSKNKLFMKSFKINKNQMQDTKGNSKIWKLSMIISQQIWTDKLSWRQMKNLKLWTRTNIIK
jgi:hypothetical protein